nr:M56 family metallopeptidase [uncultured Oribacterium sp.]
MMELTTITTDGTSIETKDRIIEEMGIKKDFRVFMNSVIPSPFIIGFVKPKIFLSENSLSDLETEIILRHEMTHLKAKD